MGVPKRRTSKMRQRTRKASHHQPAVTLRKDAKSGAKHRSHCVDPETGLYRGRQVISIEAKGA